jgi:hypothetical protein
MQLYKYFRNNPPELALFGKLCRAESCSWHRIEEELEVVKEVFDDDTLVCGFYS